jgi:cytochrome c oxidase assembly protein subunit 15
MPDGPVTVMKAWIEMIHRYVAMGIGVLILAMMAVTWRRWLRSRRIDTRLSPALPTALLVFIGLQGAFGAWTVTMRLQPIIVTIHLLLGMLLLALLTWLGAHQDDHPPSRSSAALRRPAALALTLLFAQIGLGGWVSTNYAAMACADVPFCHGELVPEMDFANGFTLWRKLGETCDGGHLPFAALTAIHWTHRVVAIAVIAWVGWCAYRALGVAELRKTGRGLLLALALQAATGIATVYLNLPLALAVLHNGGAALLVVLLVVLNYKSRAASVAQASDAKAEPVTG